MRSIILASSSPRRKQLLESVGLSCKIDPSNIEEKMNPRLGPVAQATNLALQKAMVVVERYKGKDAVLIAADSIVIVENEQLGKPEDLEDAKRMLRKLSGKKQVVVTGFVIVDCLSGKKIVNAAKTTLFMRKLTDLEINSYVKKEHILDKAGSYTLEGLGAVLFEKIEGDYSNVLGLPMATLYTELKKFGVHLL